MKYTEERFARDLTAELDRDFDPVRIAKWAFTVWSDPDRRDRALTVTECLHTLALMEQGPEFYLTEQEIREMAKRTARSD